MIKRQFGHSSTILTVAFYYSTGLFTLPISRRTNARQNCRFTKSKWRSICVLIALGLECLSTYKSFDHLNVCAVSRDCAQSYVTVIEACYAVTLLGTAKFFVPSQMCALLNVMTSEMDFRFVGKAEFFVKFFIKLSSLYVLIVIELMRKWSIEPLGDSIFGIISLYYTRCVIHSFDNLVLTCLFMLELKFYVLNRRLAAAAAQGGSLTKFQLLLREHWETVTILKETSACLGPLLLGILFYKQVQVAAMIYFNLLSTLPDNGNDVQQILDTTLPMFVVSLICFQSSTVISQCHQFNVLHQNSMIVNNGRLLQGHSDAQTNLLRLYPKLHNLRTIQITASNFIILRAGLLVKIFAVASTSIIAIVQLNPLPANMTIPE